MVKEPLAAQKKTSPTLEVSSSPELTLALLSPEAFTLIFPWGSSPVFPKRSLNYLQYCMDLPQEARTLAIQRLLGLKPYRRKWWTLNWQRLRRSSKMRLEESMRRAARQRTGTGFIENT